MKMPRVVTEEVLLDRYGKLVIDRYFLDPDEQERNFLLWGGKATPVIVLPVTKDKEVVAIRSFRRAANEYLIEIPGGNPGIQEGIEACGRRELLEETGYVAGTTIEFGPRWFEPAACFTSFVPLLALDCQEALGQRLKLDETEKAESVKVVLIGIAEWFKMIDSGEIRDSKTITTTFLARRHL